MSRGGWYAIVGLFFQRYWNSFKIGFLHGLFVLGRIDACGFQFAGFIQSLACLFKEYVRVCTEGKPVFFSVGLSEFHSPQFGTEWSHFQIQATAIEEFVGLVLRFGIFHLPGDKGLTIRDMTFSLPKREWGAWIFRWRHSGANYAPKFSGFWRTRQNGDKQKTR